MDLLQGRRVGIVAGALAAVFVATAAMEGELVGASAYALVVLNTAPLLMLHRNPVAVALTFAVTYPLWLDPPFSDVVRGGHVLQSLPTLVALFASGAWERPLRVRALALVTPLWMLGAAAVGYWTTAVDELAYVAVVLFVVWCLGVADANRRGYAAQLELRTRELEQARHDALALLDGEHGPRVRAAIADFLASVLRAH